MAMQPTAKEDREARETEKHGKSPLVVVELARRRSPDQVRRLRKGRGKLVRRIDDIVGELIEAGTIKASAQPVVIVVRERTPLPWPFAAANNDDDDD